MEAVRQIIDSSLLSGVIPLPKEFQNRKVELVVLLKEDSGDLPSFTKSEIASMLKGSVTESLIGALPPSEITAEEYRAQRLAKYEYPV